MKALFFIKTAMVIMGLLIIIGFGLIVYKIADKNQTSKVKSALPQKVIPMALGENIISVTPCGEYVCVLVSDQTRTDTLYVLDPKAGHTLNKISFEKQDH